MSQNSADFAGMKKGLELITNAGNDLRKDHSGVQGEVAAVAQSWSANSAQMFQGVMTQFDEEMQRMLTALETIESKLENVLNIQIETDQDSDLQMTDLQKLFESSRFTARTQAQ
ncbi:WXG100 family type VII secretion target [Streptomyces sp. NPDC000410]|uniref:WXG100 family type VII secretion target n=1 Tax=Streptomyces sp. NPDC000410 TaxID=3154254 RepID=UPI003319ED82